MNDYPARGGTPWDERPWPRAFFTAVQFLTRLPVPGGGSRDISNFADEIRRGLVFFPLIGAMVGALTALALIVLSAVLPWPAAVIAALAIEARLTGAFHEDAVADFCDAFGGGRTREEVLLILRDSRIGSYGALGLGLAVALRAAGLVALATVALAAPVLIVAGCVGRLVILVVMATVPPVADREGLSKDVGQKAGWTTAAAGAAIASPVLVVAAVLDPIALVLIAVGLLAFVWWLARMLMRRIGGVTGDCLGFSAYAGIVLATLAFARTG